uniref:Uncharacterized protein n=1 Tax=Clytia hemisphaerica TaxID=252671 RepID=A0A7M5WK22_9CNID
MGVFKFLGEPFFTCPINNTDSSVHYVLQLHHSIFVAIYMNKTVKVFNATSDGNIVLKRFRPPESFDWIVTVPFSLSKHLKKYHLVAKENLTNKFTLIDLKTGDIVLSYQSTTENHGTLYLNWNMHEAALVC